MSIIPRITCIYLLYCSGNHKFYIGSAVNLQQRRREHLSDLRRNIHANPILQNTFNKYGESSFEFYVLEECSREETLAREQVYLDMLQPPMNLLPMAKSRLGSKHTPETCAKLREIVKNRVLSPEAREKMGAPMRGKKLSPERIEKLRAGRIGKTVSAEAKAKLSAIRRGKPLSLETKAKLRAVNIGRKHTPESRAKMSEAQSRRTHSPETRSKIGLASSNRSPETLAKMSAARKAWWEAKRKKEEES